MEREMGGNILVANSELAAQVRARTAEIERLRHEAEAACPRPPGPNAGATAIRELVGSSRAMGRLRKQVEQVAATDATVLVLGESGTGKELVARELHRRSLRAHAPLIRVNCGSIPEHLFESEFFGHVRGAFTGAVVDRPGRFGAADGATLFLDEVGEIPLHLQCKLLRVLQDGEYTRVGEETSRRADVRIIAATNRDLAGEVAAGRFRSDLFYRLSVFPLRVPPLRGRPEDIRDLAALFVARAALRMRRPHLRLDDDGLASLMRHRWPGNVRELQNVIERAAIMARDDVLDVDLAPCPDRPAPAAGERVLTEDECRQLWRANIVNALRLSGWQIGGRGGAAQRLDVSPSTLKSRMRALGIRKPTSGS